MGQAVSDRERIAERRSWGPKPNYPKIMDRVHDADDNLIVIAGPCSVESPKHAKIMAERLELHAESITFARGGLFRAGTYPRDDFGLKRAVMRSWAAAARSAGLRTIIEVLDVRQIESVAPYADAFQVGARHCQDYVLLKALSEFDRPVTLKRGMGMTLDEFLGAAEYLARGRCSPILIERGSATNMNHVRWDLSISIIPAIKRMGVKIPVLVDASHGTGRFDLVTPMTLAGIAAGADGFLVEVHDNPRASLSDADQAIDFVEFEQLYRTARRVKRCLW